MPFIPRTEYEKNIATITTMNEMIGCFRGQNYNRAERMMPRWSQGFSQTMETLFTEKEYFNRNGVLVDEAGLMDAVKGILQAQEQGDYVLVADLFELQLIPFLYSIQDVIRHNEGSMLFTDYRQGNLEVLKAVHGDAELLNFLATPTADTKTSGQYTVEDTALGCPTIKYTDTSHSYYLHSNQDPIAEGFKLASEYYHEERDHYIVYGLGMGYHIEALSQLCDRFNRIDVYESNPEVIYKAFTYRNLTGMLQGNVYLHYDPDFTKLQRRLVEGTDGLMLHAPSIRSISNEAIRNSMNELFVQESSIRNQGADMLRNFKSNRSNCKLYVDILKEKFENRTVFLIAAGPSLDKNVEQLKNRPENSIILSVGTAYRKLMAMGIRPDYVMFLDAAPRMYIQAASFTQETIPYLIASTACRRIAMDYQGPKYLVCQKDYTEAEAYAEAHGFTIYQSGGSVSTIALDVAIRLGAAKVICLGLDLAYTGDKMHAAGAGRYELTDTEDMLFVKDWNGELVKTSPALNMYRKWIERQIEKVTGENSHQELINATEGGAFIQGMHHMTLAEAMDV